MEEGGVKKKRDVLEVAGSQLQNYIAAPKTCGRVCGLSSVRRARLISAKHYRIT